MSFIKKNHILAFMINRYASYALLFIRGILMAKFLDPYYFGIWGFFTLVLQYFSYSSFGINYAITVQLSIGDQSESDNDRYSSIALFLTAIIDLVFLAAGILFQFSDLDLFSKFEFKRYVILILLIASFNNLQQVFVNIYRVKKKLLTIAVLETLASVILLTTTIIFRNKELIMVQLFFMMLTNLVSVIVYFIDRPFRFRLHLETRWVRSLFSLGFPLLIYNLSFYLITISARSVVSAFYPAEILGYYSLANSISYATLLGLQSIAWAIYPEVLENFSRTTDQDIIREKVNVINRLYNTSCFLMINLVIFFIPLLLLFLPQYRSAISIITILMIAQGFLSTTFGYNSLAIAQKRQKSVANIGFLIILFIVFFSVLVALIHQDHILIALIVLIGSILYSALQTRLGLRIFSSSQTLLGELRSVYPIGTIIAFMIYIVGSFTSMPFLWNCLALIIFLVSNFAQIRELWFFAKKKIHIR